MLLPCSMKNMCWNLESKGCALVIDKPGTYCYKDSITINYIIQELMYGKDEA